MGLSRRIWAARCNLGERRVCTWAHEGTGGLDGAQDAAGASLASGQKPPHLVKEVRMNKGKR